MTQTTTDTEQFTSSLRFAQLARDIGTRARTLGLEVPSFRSPPRTVSGNRLIRQERDGSTTIAVRIKERQWQAVAVDMIDGVLEANGAGLHARGAKRSEWRPVLFESAGLSHGPDPEPGGGEVEF